MRFRAFAVLLMVSSAAPLLAQGGATPSNASRLSERPTSGDTAYSSMQKRGGMAMGVDQYTSTHRFDALPTGGRIELQRDSDDPKGIAAIRDHIRGIANALTWGNFSTPELVHMKEVPGAKVMREKRRVISYRARDLPRGAELVIVARDARAIEAVHEFMAFQREEHHAGGMEGMRHTP
ncbi:hypothetical protein BH11GEM2_BH11GEM2_40460 [soil metagenome]